MGVLISHHIKAGELINSSMKRLPLNPINNVKNDSNQIIIILILYSIFKLICKLFKTVKFISKLNFSYNFFPGEIVTKEPLDREYRPFYDLIAEARDQGIPFRSTRVPIHINVMDVNDNAPEIVDPQEDVVSVREEQPIGTDVVKVRAIDPDNGNNASISYSILKGRDSDGFGFFTIDPVTGQIKTAVPLDHEERSIYRLTIAATDGGKPPKQTVRLLRIEVLDLNDNRPTFTSSSLSFTVS